VKIKALKSKCAFIIIFTIIESVALIICCFSLSDNISSEFSGISVTVAIAIVALGVVFSSYTIWKLTRDREKSEQYKNRSVIMNRLSWSCGLNAMISKIT